MLCRYVSTVSQNGKTKARALKGLSCFYGTKDPWPKKEELPFPVQIGEFPIQIKGVIWRMKRCDIQRESGGYSSDVA